MEVASALELLARVDTNTAGSAALSSEDWQDLQARLMLSRKLFGGLIGDSHLTVAYEPQYARVQERRAHNWELLRQAAESNGLYFDPLNFGERRATHVLLWISKADLQSNLPHRFDSNLLAIHNPWAEESVRNWRGYTQISYFDAQRRRVPAGTSCANPTVMIPLAVYSLDSDRAPLLLADFRDPWKPKRLELLKRSADAIATGVLGYTGFGNLGYLSARMSWYWLRHRHGATVDRSERASLYAELRHLLALDGTLDPQLRRELQSRLDHLSINPFERSFDDESELARQQYAALLQFARSPEGLPVLLARERGREAVAISDGRSARTFLGIASVSTLGLYRHREPVTQELLALLDRQRRIDADIRYLRRVADSAPRIEVVWNMDEVGRRVEELGVLIAERSESREEAVGLIGRILAQTQDTETRRRCLNCLARLNGQGTPPVEVLAGAGE